MNLVEPTYGDIAILQTYFLFAIHDEIYQEINQLYEQDEVIFKKRIQELDKTINNAFMNGLPVELKWRTLKTIVVLERPTVEEEVTLIFTYIKKGYKRMYDFAQMNPQFNIKKAIAFIMERYGQLPDSIIQCLISSYYISLPNSDQFVNCESMYEKIYTHHLEIHANKSAYQYINPTPEIKDKALKLYTALTNKKWRGSEKKYLKNIFEDIELATLPINSKTAKELLGKGLTKEILNTAPLKYLKFGNEAFRLLGYDNLLMYTNIFIEKEEWFKLYEILEHIENEGITVEDELMMMCYILLFFAQHKLYENLAKEYEAQMYHISLNEINQAREIFEEDQKMAEKEKQAQVATYTTQINQLSEDVMKLQHEKESLEKQVKRLQQELDKQQSKVELSERLLETIFNETSEGIFEENEISLPEKVVYIGGHPSLQKQLKEQYSNWYFIAVEDLQRGEQQVKQADLVIFNSHYNNHAQFERLKDLLRPQCVLFAKYGSNIQLHLQDIQMQYRQIQQKLGV